MTAKYEWKNGELLVGGTPAKEIAARLRPGVGLKPAPFTPVGPATDAYEMPTIHAIDYACRYEVSPDMHDYAWRQH